MKSLFTSLLILLAAAAPMQPQSREAGLEPQQDQMVIEAANRKVQRTLAELQRDSATIYLRLAAEMDKAQRHAEVQQEQARLDLAAKTALATARLARGTEDQGPEMRRALSAEITQAAQAFNQRLAEIDAEQNQSIAQAVQRFAQQKAEARDSHVKDLTAHAQRLTQELAAPDMGAAVASFKVTLPPFAHPGAAGEAEDELERAYRAKADAARQAYAQAIDEARQKVVSNIHRSLEAAPEALDDEQVTEIKNAIKRLGLWAADSMDTYQIEIKRALREYQLAEDPPATQAAKR